MDKVNPSIIIRRLIMYAYQKIGSNKSVAGLDGMGLDEFDKDYKDYSNHLYKLWNRMSSRRYIPPVVSLVEEILKKGDRLRLLDIAKISDRVGQTVVRVLLKAKLGVFQTGKIGNTGSCSGKNTLLENV